MASRGVLFASRVFRCAAIYGVIVLAPLYLLPLPSVEPQNRLGFIGTALAFQWVFWLIGGDPVRFRALMLPAVAEKLVFSVPVMVFVAKGMTPKPVAGFAAIDIGLAVAFFAAWRRITPS